MNMGASEIYSEEYFTSKSNYSVSGYNFDALYPYFSYIAKGIKKLFSPKNALDIGCAKGFLVYALQEQGVDAYGVDVSQYAVLGAPKETKGTLMLADVEQHNLPFCDASFDLVLLLDVIEHLHSHNHLLSEIHRILKPQGICCLKTPLEMSLLARSEPTHINLHGVTFWINAFNDNGFLCIDNRFLIKETWAKYYQNTNPSTRIGELLAKFGGSGACVRKKLIQTSTYYALKDTLFVLKKVEK